MNKLETPYYQYKKGEFTKNIMGKRSRKKRSYLQIKKEDSNVEKKVDEVIADLNKERPSLFQRLLRRLNCFFCYQKNDDDT